MGLGPSEAWYVGDSVFHDVNGALAASMARAILVDPYGLGPDDVVKVRSVTELVL
jgi:FMN phosphatase YigB (HAD superfamily)